MSRDDFNLVWEGQNAVVDGLEQGSGIAAGQVGASDRAGEESISGDEKGMVGEIEATAAFGVAWGVDDGAAEAGDGDNLAVLKIVIGDATSGVGYAEPAGLHIHHLDQGQI